MAKYIIDIPDEAIEFMGSCINVFVEPEFKIGECKHYALRLSKEDLVPYAQLDHKVIEDEVWEFARRIICPSDCCEDSISAHTKEIFNKEGWEIRGIFNDLSYQEAKAKYNEWMEQKDEIKVGDEIVGIYSDGEKSPPLIVLKVEGNYYYGIYSKTGDFIQGGLNYEKTGRHFPEVAELLNKLKGEE